MEVDNDIDSQLLQQFSSMGTNDKEVLIAEFQRLLGDQLNAAGCAFYLDMNNWNLQNAICSYYDLEQPQLRLPSMSFMRDITIGEGESIPPSTAFVKTWRIQNSGEEAWPPGCCLKYVSGVQFGHIDRIMVDAVNPSSFTDISVEMISPSETGLHQGKWRMSTATGTCFGEFIWVILQVEENGLMGVTQQMSQFGGEFAHHSPHQPVQNPFASPIKDQTPNSPQLSSPGTNALLCNSSFEQNQIHLGSPMGSDIAQHGSFPNSPCVPHGVQTMENQEPVQGRTAESVRATLFPVNNMENSPISNHVITTPEAFQGLCSETEQRPEFSDSVEMS